ncbi:MAG: ABC transporter permease [Acidobacteriota bacterium]
MFLRILFKSTLHRPASLVWSLLTLTACSALVALFVTAGLGIQKRITGEFNRLGSNALIAPYPPEASPLDTAVRQADWTALKAVAGRFKVQLVELRLRVGVVEGLPVGFVTADCGKLAALTPYWRINGRRPERPGGCLVGAQIARRLHLETGGTVHVSWHAAGTPRVLRVTGILHSGDSDENRIFMSAFTGHPPSVRRPDASPPGHYTYGLLSVPGGLSGIQSFSAAVRGQHLPFRVDPLRQVLYGEQTVLEKTYLLFTLALFAVLALTLLGLTAAVISRTLERSREISLMRAVGAERKSVAVFLLSEAGLKGAGGGLLGFVSGSWLALLAGRIVFHGGFPPRFEALAASFGLSVAVSLFAGFAGMRRALRENPSVLLRSE